MANYVQNFSGDISIDGGIALDGGITANVSANETAYEYQKGLNLTLANEGTYYFVGCGGNVTIENANAIVYLIASPFVTINNSVRAKTYRDGFAVGDILSTISEISPVERYGGVWEQITGDAYLKIVKSSAGAVGGTSTDHKIPIGSMPQHNHGMRVGYGQGAYQPFLYELSTASTDNVRNDEMLLLAGGGLPYYPYYYGVYVWQRTTLNNQE